MTLKYPGHLGLAFKPKITDGKNETRTLKLRQESVTVYLV